MTDETNPDRYWLELDLRVACRLTPLSRTAFMEAAGISVDELEGGDDKLIAHKIWTTIDSLTGRPESGLDVLDELRLDDFGDLGLAVITSNDFQSAIHSLVTLSGTLSRRWKFEFADNPKYPYVAFKEVETEYAYTHHSIDSTIALGTFLARTLLGKSHYDVYRVNFTHPDFGLGKHYEERLGCRCRFNQKLNSVEFAAESLCHPMPLRNKQLHEALLMQLQNQLANESDPKSKTRYAIYEVINQQLWPSRQRVADVLGVGERTLLRQLQTAEITFRDLQEEVLERETIRLLKTGLPAEKIAEKLGYAGSSPLARMIKRRTGKKLSELRQH